MRRLGLVFVGVLGIWLGGCVSETAVPDGIAGDGVGEESSSGSESGNGSTGIDDGRLRAGMAEVGSTQQSLRSVEERPPPQPWHSGSTPPSPNDGR